MINLNSQTKLPKQVIWYVLSKLVLLLFLISFIFLLFSAKLWGSVFLILIIFLGIPLGIYFLLYYHFLSFVVSDNATTINSGIIVKRSKSIAFNSVQNVNNVKGILARMFGISKVSIWTSSPSQIHIENRKSDNKPDGALKLGSADADWLKNFILEHK